MRLQNEYAALPRSRSNYAQLRFIDTSGQERIRVDRRGGQVSAISGPDLQDKSQRYYHLPLLALDKGQIYISPLDLNVEKGRIETPFKPMLRLGIGAYDQTGRRRGSVLINLDAAGLLSILQQVTSDVWLLNRDGYWLMGPNASDEWAFMFPGGQERRFSKQFPAAWRTMVSLTAGGISVGGQERVFQRIHPLDAQAHPNALVTEDNPSLQGADYWIMLTPLGQPPVELANQLAKRLGLAYAALTVLVFAASIGIALLSARNRALRRLQVDVVDNLPNLVAYIDAKQRYRFSNKAYEQWFNIRRSDITGKQMREILGDTAYAQIQPYVEKALSGQTVSFESRIDFLGLGPREVSVDCIPDPARTGAEQGFYAVVSDVSALKDAQRRERESLLALAHASRLASIGEVATEIAHQVNQPLSAIGMYCAAATKIMERDAQPPGQVQEYLAAINKQAKRAGEIILGWTTAAWNLVRPYEASGMPPFFTTAVLRYLPDGLLQRLGLNCLALWPHRSRSRVTARLSSSEYSRPLTDARPPRLDGRPEVKRSFRLNQLTPTTSPIRRSLAFSGKGASSAARRCRAP